jgi:putative SOS response-associated peptidase YedK
MARWTLLRSTSNPCAAATIADRTSSASPRLFHLGKLPDRCVLPPWDYNVAPTTFPPVIRPSRDTGEREIALMRWGQMPFFADSIDQF